MEIIVGIDYGQRRIGLAVSDPSGTLAVTAGMLEVESAGEAVARTAAALRAQGATRAVVGLPLNMNGTRGPMAAEAEAFARALGAAAGLPVDLWDERLSTAGVERALIDADMSRAKRKRVRDTLAAQAILQSYLDAHAPA